MNDFIVSIIVPVYNVEKYIEKCIESIIKQSYSNLEIILVNDGTNDTSGSICEKYCELDERIKYITKLNGGLSSARNAGLEIATGEFVLFVDSDDFIDIDLVKDCVLFINNNNTDLVIFNYNKIYENGIISKGLELSLSNNTYNLNEIGLDNYFYKYFLNYKHGVEAWNRFYKRSLIENNGIRFVDNKKIFAEDLLFNLYYLVHVKKIGTIEKSYYNYLIRNSSIMAMPNEKLISRFFMLFKSFEIYLEGKNTKLKKVLPLAFFLWLIYAIKSSLNNGFNKKDVLEELNLISKEDYFKVWRNDLLFNKSIFKFWFFNSNKFLFCCLTYIITLSFFIRKENCVVKMISVLFKTK